MAPERGGTPPSRLQIRVASRKLIKASDHNLAPYVLSVSNLDLLHSTYQMALVSVYPRPPTGDFASSVVTTIEASLPDFLNYYFPFAGQIVTDPKTGLPEVHCNNHGVELVIGHAAVPLAEVDFHDMDASINMLQLPFAEEIPLSVQAVAFTCGGFTISWVGNHLVADGYSMAMLASQWCEFVRTAKLSALPNHDRSIFRPRVPPTYGLALDHALTPWPGDDGLINVLSSDAFIPVLYHMDGRSIRRLQGLASREGRRATRMEAVSAYLWKVLAELVGDADKTCRMAWWVDGRRRLGGREDVKALQNYVGSVVTCASAEARVENVRRSWSLSQVAGVASDAIRAVANEAHFQELIDWVEEHKTGRRTLYRVELGLGSPAIAVSSLVNFRMDGDFGFGQPALTIPVLPGGRLGAALLLIADRPNGDGSWIAGAFVWRKLAQALESDPNGIFKPVTADSLGLRHP